MRQPLVQDGTSVKLQGQGLDVRGQGQGLDVQGQGQGLQKRSSRRLEAMAVASRTSSRGTKAGNNMVPLMLVL